MNECTEKNVCRPNFLTEKPKRPFSAEFFRNGLNCLVRKDFQTLFLLLTWIVKIWNNINNNNEDRFTSLHSLLNKHWRCQLLDNILLSDFVTWFNLTSLITIILQNKCFSGNLE